MSGQRPGMQRRPCLGGTGRCRRGITLIDLVIAALLGILLFSVGLSNFFHVQYRTQRGELLPNVAAIQAQEIAYHLAHGDYVQQPDPVPRAQPSPELTAWTDGTGFDRLGWAPDGAVRGVYEVVTLKTGTSRATDFRVRGASDVDGDGVRAVYTATRTTPVTFQNKLDTY